MKNILKIEEKEDIAGTIVALFLVLNVLQKLAA